MLIIFIGVSSAFGQYPEYQWINPYRREEIGRQNIYSQAFDKSQSFSIEGRNLCEITPTPEGLKIVSQGNTP